MMPLRWSFSSILCITSGYGFKHRDFAEVAERIFLHLGSSTRTSTCDHFLLGIREVHRFHRCGIHIGIAGSSDIVRSIVCISSVSYRRRSSSYSNQSVAYLDGVFSRTRILQVTDERVKIMSEIIKSMRIVKMYCWESAFDQKIRGVRK